MHGEAEDCRNSGTADFNGLLSIGGKCGGGSPVATVRTLLWIAEEALAVEFDVRSKF